VRLGVMVLGCVFCGYAMPPDLVHFIQDEEEETRVQIGNSNLYTQRRN